MALNEHLRDFEAVAKALHARVDYGHHKTVDSIFIDGGTDPVGNFVLLEGHQATPAVATVQFTIIDPTRGIYDGGIKGSAALTNPTFDYSGEKIVISDERKKVLLW